MSAVVVDTSAYSGFKKGNAEVVRALRLARRILVPTTVIGELLGGFEAGNQRAQNRSELEAFLSSPRVLQVPTSRETTERYAAIYATLRTAGTPIPTNDVWIAATAMEHGAAVLTLDRHYLRVPQILVRCPEGL